MSEANKRQVAGNHYKGADYETWDFIADVGLDYFTGNAVKYLSRHTVKGGKTDLLKAHHYLQKKLELLESKPQQLPTQTSDFRVQCLLRYLEAHQFDANTRIAVTLVVTEGASNWVGNLHTCCKLISVMAEALPPATTETAPKH